MYQYSKMMTGMFMVILVYGCGGGSGSGMLPQPGPYDTMVSEVSEILESSDTLLMTDVLLAHPSAPEGERIQTSCGQTQCNASYSGDSLIDISLSDFEFNDPTTYDHKFSTDSDGIKMVDIRGRDEEAGVVTDYESLAGWLDYSAFGIEVFTVVSGVSDGVDLKGTIFGGGYSLGDATGTTPTGNATWTGKMFGGDTSSTAHRGKRIQGDATLTFNLSQSDLDVAFTNIQDIDAERQHKNIAWQNVPVTSGSFSNGIDGNSIDGRIYGPNHEEIGGIFERNQILGAFGAKQ